jgi:hypothetical protein
MQSGRSGAAKRDPATACASALFAAARAGGVGTRQGLRAAARRFVRQHRRNTSYLRWVARGVGASSALAVALLGLAAAPATAEIAPFGATLQFGVDTGQNSTVALGDLDGDGDLDTIAGEIYGTFVYFGGFSAVSQFLTSSATQPLVGVDVGSFPTPSLGDLDADGDLDLVSGRQSGDFVYFENTGSAAVPAFILRTGAANPLAGMSAVSYSSPTLGDVDGDGDLDLVSAGSDVFFYFENTGSAESPAFAARTGAANPLVGVVLPGGIPALGDLDADGDLDLVAGENFGTFATFENTGSATHPAFVARAGNANPLVGWDVGSTSAPALGDLDGDGFLDVMSGEFAGSIRLFRSEAGKMVRRVGPSNPLDAVFVSGGTPEFVDLDDDGDADLVSGDSGGVFRYFENTGSATNAAFVARAGAANPLDGQSVGVRSIPTLADIDADGDLDLLSGELSGTLFYFENTGSPTSPAFAARTGAANPLDGLDVGNISSPAFGDLDGDADFDLMVGSNAGTYTYLENTGSPASPAFVLRLGASNPLHGVDVGSGATLVLGDVDRDGDRDAVTGATDGALLYYENIGTATSPAFLLLDGTASPFIFAPNSMETFSKPALADFDGNGLLDLVPALLTNGGSARFLYFQSFVLPSRFPGRQLLGTASPLFGKDVGSRAAPALADLDRDGDTDLLAGEDLGAFRYLENTGTLIAPAFAERAGAAHPLAGRSVGGVARPAFGDLDGDGDFDVLSGRLAGDFDYFANSGSATSPLFAAPLANPFGLAGVGSESSPALADVDADGDLDAVVGRASGDLAFFENTGSATSPAFLLRTGFFDPFFGVEIGAASTPALADFDGDGDLDLVAGQQGGTLVTFRNVGDVTFPLFEPQVGIGNPLGDVDVGDRSTPAAADLNGDAIPDLVTGAESGTFAVRYLPEPAQGLLLGAGIALLARLDAMRCRRRDRPASAIRPAARPVPTPGSGSS